MKKINGFDNYFITETGKVYNSKRERFLKTKPNKRGYVQITLGKNNIKYKFFVHRLVAEAYIPNLQNKKYVNHIDGIKSNNSVDNLEWVTSSENRIHANDLINRNKGISIKCSKLTEYDVISLLLFFKKVKSLPIVSKKFNNVNSATIHSILTNKNWKHVLEEERESILNLYHETKVKRKRNKLTIIRHEIDTKLLEENELYADVEDYQNYVITSFGRIFSKVRNKFLLKTLNNEGYEIITLRNNNKQKTFKVHRLVLFIFKPTDEPSTLYVNHIDGIRNNNKLRNLEWVTQKENMQKSVSAQRLSKAHQ